LLEKHGAKGAGYGRLGPFARFGKVTASVVLVTQGEGLHADD
jgi:hypothetical protein